MNVMRKAVIFCAGLLAGMALMFVSQHIIALEAGSATENFSDFLRRLEDRPGIKEVTFTGGTGIAYVTADGDRFTTTAPPAAFAYDGLTNRIVERGIAVRASSSN
jgi:hypothetical protein